MYYGNIKKNDIADGEGVRVTLFVSGCTNACKGCFQPETWDFCYGKPYTAETEQEILDALNHPHIQGLTLLGGEPFEFENQKELVKLLRKVKETFPGKDIWSYTGFVYDRDLVPGGKRWGEVTQEILSYIDVLVDGPFVEEKKNIRLVFRGSENQRVLNLKETIRTGQIVLYMQ
ncbi:MAG: anaerobic ribonucleoside-triphosphate reductase activating protein [Erysipelotrichaceae bacterium]|nr:anaerobic ribonucleoside-triphosphate reductase activating protein [Erysipelotrichaceae bacterium]